MPGRYTVSGPQEIRHSLVSPEAYQPQLFIGGDPSVGFSPTAAPPELGFWGVTFRDKQVNAATIESGNATTWVFNKVIDPFVPGEQRFVSLGGGMLMRRQFEGEADVDGWRALSNRISPIQNVSEFDKRIKFEDHEFDADQAADEWLSDGQNTVLAALAEREGFDLVGMLRNTRNLDHFVYTQNRILMHAQAMQKIRTWEEDAGLLTKWSSRIASGVGNYLLTDPSFAPSLFIGPGSLNAAGKSVSVGSKVTRLSAPIVGGQRALPLGRGAAAALRTPAAVHRGLSTAIGHRAAIATELGVYGGVWDAAFQQQRIEESEILFDDPEYQQHWSWAELGLAIGLGATLGYTLSALGGAIRRRGGADEMRRAATEAAGGNSSSPIARTFDNIRAQGRMDGAAVKVQRAAEAVLGDDFDSVAPYLDDALLSEHGLHRFQIADVLEDMAFALNGETVPPAAVHRVLGDMLTEARKVRGIRAELDDAFSSQMEQAALGEALGRAARELPNDASNEDVLRRAASLVPEELARIEERLQSRASQARPAAEGELAFWRSEAQALRTAAERRALTEAEIDHMGTIAGKLQSLGDDAPFAGLAQSRSQRYLDGTIFAPFRVRRGSELTRTMQKISRERRLIQELEAKRAIGDFSGEDRSALKNARDRLSRAERRVQRLAEQETASEAAPVQARRLREVIAKWEGNPPQTRAEKFRALDELSQALDFNSNALIEDGLGLSKLINSWGLGNSLFRRIAAQGTGMRQTVRSTLGVLREIAHELDSSKLRVGDLDPSKVRVHRSMEEIRTDVNVRSSELIDEYRRLHQAGKFGSSLKIRKYQQTRREFDRELIRHITGVETSQDPDVIRLGGLWKKHAEEIGDIAEAAGVFKKSNNFFPRRWNVGRINQNPTAFRQALAKHFLAKWKDNDTVHLDTLVAMGKLTREVSEDGQTIRWRRVDTGDLVSPSLQRGGLEGFGVTEEAYLRALETATDDGFTPMEQSAQRALSNLLGDTAIEETAGGRLMAKRTGAPQSEADRVLEEEVWANADLEEFLDFRFLHGADSYLRSTGFRVLNTARHQERWGIPGLRMQDTLDWIEARIPAVATAEEKELWRAGIKTMREKVHFAEGRLPTVRDQTNRLGEWLGDVGTSLAGSLYGSGIGQAVLSTELMQSLVSRVYSPTDIVRRIADVFRIAIPNKQMREQIQTLGLTVQQFRLHSLERLTGGAVHSEGFQFNPIPKLLTPFLDIFDSSVRALPNQGNKIAAGFRAHAALSMTLGGMDYFTMFSRMLHVQSMLDETGRFWRAAEKTATLLRDEADRLNRVERQAYEAAIGKGRPEEAARRAAGKARFKAWVDVARRGGFGGNWQVAERMNRAGLLNPEKLAVLRRAGQDTGALKDTGMFKTLDMNELMRWAGPTRGEQEAFDEAFNSLRDMMVGTLRKRVSEQNYLHAPVSQTSRTWLGRIQLAMTSFARSWYDNNILDTAQMPARAATSLILVYLLGESLNRVSRDLWRGRSIDDTLADIEDDPDNFIARSLTNIPVLGAWSALARPAADALTLDGRRQRIDTGESAAEGAVGSTLDIVFDSVHGVSPLAKDSEIEPRTWRTAARFIPGYRSWWATGLIEGVQAAGGPDLNIGGSGRNRRIQRIRGQIEPIPSPIEGELQTRPPIPEDLDFTYPQE